MGLDMYLKVKYYKPQNKLEAINADVNKKTKLTEFIRSGRLLGIAPVDDDNDDNDYYDDYEEIGYWRKAYSVRDLIMGTIASCCGAKEDNCVDFLITKEEVNTILEAAEDKIEAVIAAYENYNSHKDRDDGGSMHFSATEDFSAIEDFFGQLQHKWIDTVNFFTKAKDIYARCPDAEIYFEQWY